MVHRNPIQAKTGLLRTDLSLMMLTLISLALAGCGQTIVRQAGDIRMDAKGIEQVWAPAGSFSMGTAETASLTPPSWAARELASEQPQHEVRISSGYWIDRHEVSNAAFRIFVDEGGYRSKEFWSPEGWRWLGRQSIENLPLACIEQAPPDHPRVCVTWYEAEAYARWRGGRLPTEAEWEYAARGPDSLIYPWGNHFDPRLANVVDSEGLKPINSYPNGQSWVGAYNMAGNAMEWVRDWLSWDYYHLRVRDDPQGPETGERKIEKGGWWGSDSFVARCAYRHFEDPPTYQDHHIGFRIMTPSNLEP